MSDPARWFHPRVPDPAATVHLFCLPHGGAGATVYRRWAARLAPRVAVTAVQLPGRESRLSEPLAHSAREVVEPLVDPVLDRGRRPVALFGHSMGALLCFELAHALALRGRPVAHLFVSGYPAPHLADRTQAYRLDDTRFVEHVAALSDDAVARALHDPEIRRLVLPVLRADFEICETYEYAEREPLSVPITAVRGRDDPTVDRRQLAGWAELTRGPTRTEEFTGGHFYLNDQLDRLLHLVATTLLPVGGGSAVGGARA